MKIIVSPSKTFNPKPHNNVAITDPLFPSDVSILVSSVITQSDNLEKLFGVSEKIADENRTRFANWDSAPVTPAAWSYRGETFFGLSIEDMTAEQQQYAQENLYIVSGLYGLLRPQDGIKAYRLEMSTKLPTESAKDLYTYWTARLAARITTEESGFIVNCASNEYSKVITPYTDLPIVTPKFLHQGRSKMAFAKYSRGLLARWCIINEPQRIKDIEKFDLDGYRYNEEASTPLNPVFIAPENFTIKGRFTKL